MQNQAVLPELLEVDIAVKNRFWNPVLYCNVLYCTVLCRFWNPLFADPRTSIARELKWALEQELQLLVSASDIKVSEARPAALAR